MLHTKMSVSYHRFTSKCQWVFDSSIMKLTKLVKEPFVKNQIRNQSITYHPSIISSTYKCDTRVTQVTISRSKVVRFIFWNCVVFANFCHLMDDVVERPNGKVKVYVMIFVATMDLILVFSKFKFLLKNKNTTLRVYNY